MDTLNDTDIVVLNALRRRGFAVAICTPEEVGKAGADSIEGFMRKQGMELANTLNR